MPNEIATITSESIDNGISNSDTVESVKLVFNGHIQSNGKTPGKPQPLHHNDTNYKPHLLASHLDSDHLCPIHYRHDYLPKRAQWLVPPQISFDQILAGSKDDDLEYSYPESNQKVEKQNSIPLYLTNAGLPAHTGFVDFRQSRYWKSIVQATTELLELFANDQSCNELTLSTQPKPTINNDSNVENHDMNGVGIQKNHMRSMASLALEELNKGVLDSWCRFTIYMWPDADEERIKLAARTIVLIFMFDDVWETLSGQDQITHLRESLISRLLGSSSLPSHSPPTPLQVGLDNIRTGLLAYGSGGAELLEALLGFFRHGSPPKEGFRSVRSYLDHRWDDVGLRYTYTLTAFSIGSPVSVPAILSPSSPLHNFLWRLGDAISITNDLASFDKELAAYRSGKVNSIINVVDVIMGCERVDAEAAKSMAFAWQLCNEEAAVGELKRLVGMEREEGEGGGTGGVEGRGGKGHKGLSADEWAFVEACLVTATGGVVTSTVMARYGGEGARL